MYTIIPEKNRKEYTFDQLKEKFDGKWLYLVNATFTDGHGLAKAVPVVVADSELEGIDDGIYIQFHSSAYGRKADLDLTNMCVSMPSVLWSENV